MVPVLQIWEGSIDPHMSDPSTPVPLVSNAPPQPILEQQEIAPKPKQPLFDKYLTVAIWLVIGCFALSIVGTWLKISTLVTVWYLGMLAALVLVGFTFLLGIVRVFISRDPTLILSAGAMLGIFALIGFGTCALNLAGTNFSNV